MALETVRCVERHLYKVEMNILLQLRSCGESIDLIRDAIVLHLPLPLQLCFLQTSFQSNNLRPL